MRLIALSELARAVGAVAPDPSVADIQVGPQVSIDSRELTPGALFVAFPGERVDGHDFIETAAQAGAAAFLCNRVPDGLPPEIAARCVVTADSTEALGRLAHHVVTHLPDLTVIGVTGSQGKTSTKDLLAQVLEREGPTIAPAGNFNNEIGAPLTACRCDETTRYLVAEMGARGLGHISYLTGVTPPQVGIVLNVGQAHVSEFGSQDVIAQAKGELVEALPSDGWAVLNGTDRRVLAMADRTQARIALFSAGGRPDLLADAGRPDLPADGGAGDRVELRVWATEPQPSDLDQYSFLLHVETPDGEESVRVQLQLIGRHQVANAVAAAAAAYVCGVPLAVIAAGLNRAVSRSRWRMELTVRPDGLAVLNDAYNANPESMLAAVETLAAMGRARRRHKQGVHLWAVLGQMLELGNRSLPEHEAIGRAVGALQIGTLLAIGDNAPDMVTAARNSGCEDARVMGSLDEAIAILQAETAPGDIILVKASRGLRLERVADAMIKSGTNPASGTGTGDNQ
ncbi:UDP-N-acetylmuramoyl-tripeptide--D-alanyl-D-alanine ligase [Granulicoccus phenolivorans]|uniref:UDP-N-acetylmuramoyl-tripeptide--D-alanyl-D- alanine ligase n=1 Tax=Granulicoccus phenolivorans TaxID=266854 RepID=UPI0003F4E222|nr:UDP-N-acetylmuramoyl-tripeptide--D-alanyl-D-alanine ligase [Granulicoccus phenolivorans]